MSQVTALAVSANNFQTLLSNHSLAYSSAHFLSVRPAEQLRRQLAHEGLL